MISPAILGGVFQKFWKISPEILGFFRDLLLILSQNPCRVSLKIQGKLFCKSLENVAINLWRISPKISEGFLKKFLEDFSVNP